MWAKWLDKKLVAGIVLAIVLVGALACGAAEEEAPTAPAPAAPAPAAPAPAAPAPAAPAPAAPAPAPVAAPAPAAPAPAPAMMEKPTGTLTVVHFDVDEPNGLPRFCTAGCAETIYMTGATDTLFLSKALPDGSITTEPQVALDFKLDPSLEFGDFTLRQGIQFQNGWGEMTAEDVAFSYNDANSVTNPESIHGQAGDFAPLIQSMEPLDPYTVRLNYRTYDSRGILHRFSLFWQTAGIVSKKVFDAKGVEGMQDDYTGVGAFVIDEWTDDKGVFLHAFDDYWGTPLGLGPFIGNLRILQVTESASRRAMLETGEAQVAEVGLKDMPALSQKGFEIQKKAAHFIAHSVSFTGNYWERFSAFTGEELQRDRDISKPWVGDPFELGPDYDENTPSMQSSMKVRNALAWAMDREALLENINGGLGFINHQPYLSINNPNYRDEWSWGLDVDKAKQLLAEAGYPDGFEMDFFVTNEEYRGEVGEAMAAEWQTNLNVKSNLIKTAYSVYRPGLVARTTNTPGERICGDENHSNFPFDWAHGFVVSSISAGGYGVGQELPYASKSYLGMAGEPDKARREELAAEFYTQNRKWANCVGVLEQPFWVMYDGNIVAEWDMRPSANGNQAGMNNYRTIKLK